MREDQKKVLLQPTPLGDIKKVTQSFQGKTIGERKFRHPNGDEYPYYFFCGANHWFAMVLPVDTEGNVIVLHQFRHGANQYIYEFPGGNADRPDEKPEEVASRELEEETGYRAGKIIPLNPSQLLFDAASHISRVYLFAALSCTPTHKQQLDHIEFIEVVRMSPHEWLSLIDQGKVLDPKTVAMTYFARNYLAAHIL